MKIYRLTDISYQNAKYKFKYSILTSFSYVLGALGALGFIAYLVWLLTDIHSGLKDNFIPACIISIVIIVILLGLSSAIHSLRGALGNQNWIVLYFAEGLYIKYRSYLKWHFPQNTDCIVFIPAKEIESIYMSREKKEHHSLNDDNSYTYTMTYLNISLNHSDTEILKKALENELKMKAPKIGFSRTTYNNYPVRLPFPNTIAIEWSGIKPGIKKTLQILSDDFSIEETVKRQEKSWNEVNDENIDDYILELLESGRKIEAVKLLRQKYGIGLAEAMQQIKDLTGE